MHVGHTVDGDASRLVQIVVKFRRFQLVQFHQVLVVLRKIRKSTFIARSDQPDAQTPPTPFRPPPYPCALGQLIENVVVPLASTLKRYSGLFQQVILNYASFYHPFTVETHLHELAKTTGIVVTRSLRVSCKNTNYTNNRSIISIKILIKFLHYHIFCDFPHFYKCYRRL